MSASWSDERGSMPLFLLVAIVLGGVVVVAFGLTQSSQQTARHDRDFQEAVQVADAGIQAAYSHLAARDPDLGPQPSDPEPFLTSTEVEAEVLAAGGSANSQVGDGEFEWIAKRVGRFEWQLRTTGSVGGVDAIVEGTAGQQSLFPEALFGIDRISGKVIANVPPGRIPNWQNANWSGNGLSTYDPSLPPGDSRLDGPVGAGTNSGNCDMSPQGNADDSDLPQTGYGPQPPSGGTCLNTGPLQRFPPVEACPAGATVQTNPVWTGTVNLARGTVLCINGNLTINSSAQVNVVGTGDAPVEIYFEENAGLAWSGPSGQQANINVQENTGPPRAVDLQMYFAGDVPLIEFNIQNRFAGVIYAPGRVCNFATQTLYYGAITCNEITTSGPGGLQFYHDIETRNLTADGSFVLRGYTAEFPDTSTFEWGAGS